MFIDITDTVVIFLLLKSRFIKDVLTLNLTLPPTNEKFVTVVVPAFACDEKKFYQATAVVNVPQSVEVTSKFISGTQSAREVSTKVQV